MKTKFVIGVSIANLDTRENLIESIRLQALQQDMIAQVNANDPTMFKITLSGEDRGKLVAFEAAVRTWAREQEG